MSDWPAPSSAVPRKHSPLKGCIGALPQMFQWSRVLGSNNKCITTAADVQMPSLTSGMQTRITARWTKQSKPVVLRHRDNLGQSAAAVSHKSAIPSSSAWKVSENKGGMDLRQVLHAKQEPFVLQEVIREKRQPMRTPSSRELKFEAPRRSVDVKNRTTSKDQGQAAGGGYSAGCQSQSSLSPKTPTGSAAVVRRNRVPVESMVAIPSHQAQAVGGGHSATKAHTRVASLGRNPDKSPNKRVLLMEAATRILEGCNRRTSKPPSTSVRSLLEDLDKSKHVKGPQQKLVRAMALQSVSSEREEVSSPLVLILGKTAAESKQHHSSYDLKCLGKRNNDSSCQNNCEMPQMVEEDLLVMQKRVFRFDDTLDAAVPSLATPVQNQLGSENKSLYEQLHDDLRSGKKGFNEKTLNLIVGVSSRATMGAVTIAVMPEVIITKDHHPQLHYTAPSNRRKAIVPSTSIYAHPKVMLMSTCLPSFDYRTPSLITSVLDYSLARHLKWGYHAAAPFPVDSPEKGERSSVRTIGGSLTEGVKETGYSSRDNFVEAETLSSVTQLRLCNYSWWASCPNDSLKHQLSTGHCDGYTSPVAVRCPSYFGKVWKEEMCEEGDSSYVYPMEPFQQASPVSVLEPVSEDELELVHSFDNFEEARQKLLKNLRRYEMLAQMDVGMLKKVSEEHVCYGWDDNKSWETDYDYSCSSSHSGGASDSSCEASPGHDISSNEKEAQDASKCLRQQPYVFFLEDRSLVEMRWTSSLEDCLTEESELRPIGCRVKQCQRVVGGDHHIKEVAGKTSCNAARSMVPYVVNSLLHEDLLAMSLDWSSCGKQEEEKVELELESCFFEVLVCELLSDLLQPQLKP